MTDLISRQAAINLFEKYGAEDDAITLLNSLPTAQPGWTPCCTALPKENGYYLTTTMYNAVCLDYWNTDNFDRTEIVLAWMPLPTPWKGEQNERFD